MVRARVRPRAPSTRPSARREILWKRARHGRAVRSPPRRRVRCKRTTRIAKRARSARGSDRMIDTIAERLTPERRESREVVPSAVLGVLALVACESMFFAGLVSAFTIVKSTAVVWPPVGQPRLPFEETAINTAALLASALILRVAAKRYKDDPWAAERPFLATMLLGIAFVVLQGREWAALLSQALSLLS